MMELSRAPMIDSVVRATRVDRPRAHGHVVAAVLALSVIGLGLWLRPLLGVSVPFVLFVLFVLQKLN